AMDEIPLATGFCQDQTRMKISSGMISNRCGSLCSCCPDPCKFRKKSGQPETNLCSITDPGRCSIFLGSWNPDADRFSVLRATSCSLPLLEVAPWNRRSSISRLREMKSSSLSEEHLQSAGI